MNANAKYWFDCDCGHTFETVLSAINRGRWCPYCCFPTIKLCDKEDCKQCFDKSFASHEKAQYWHNEKNGDVKPRDVFKSCNKKYYFTCNDCNHVFDAALNNIAGDKWCPYCALKKLCEDNNCIMCFNNSFASIDRSKQLNDKSISSFSGSTKRGKLKSVLFSPFISPENCPPFKNDFLRFGDLLSLPNKFSFNCKT